MIYTAIDTFYLAEEELENSPSWKDGIDEVTENTLRIYGCDLIQESGILLRLPQAVMATGQVLFHRFYCKKSFAKFNVKRVAASCVWLASKLEESPRRARQVLVVFHRMECRREDLPIEHLDAFSKKYTDLKADLIRTERHLLKEMGFICHVEHPHKFISNYLATLETPPELTALRQEAWNLANDSLRTTLCVRFKSEVVACGVIYAACRRFQVPLPENPPWWKAFDADKSGIDEVCRVLAHVYSLPKAQYMPVCKEGSSLTASNRCLDLPKKSVTMDVLPVSRADEDKSNARGGSVTEEVTTDADSLKLKESKKEKNVREESESKSISDHRTESVRGSRGRSRGREIERDESERDRYKVKERGHRVRDTGKDSGGRLEKHHSSRDHGYYSSSHSSRDKDRRKHHSYA